MAHVKAEAVGNKRLSPIRPTEPGRKFDNDTSRADSAAWRIRHIETYGGGRVRAAWVIVNGAKSTVVDAMPSVRRNGASSMVWIRVEVVGDADEVIRVLGHLGGATVRVPDGEQIPAMGQNRSETNPVLEPSAVEISPAPLSGVWTEELAADFTASLDAVARCMALCVWRSGTAGIHRSALCQRTELTPAELSSLLMRMGHALRRFQRERGMTLPRPVVGNSPLQSYFVDPDFAAVAASWMLAERILDQPADGEDRP